MNEVIPASNTELLAQILGDMQNRAYINVVRDVQKQLSESPDVIDVPVQHHFAPGVYMRQMDAVAGTLVVSKMHRTEHMNILLKGSLTVATEDGIQLMTAPCVLKSMPGTKRIGYFHEDSSWITIHPTSDTDLEKIEQQVIVPDDEIDQFLASLPNRLKEIE
jgi:hypothetical protein